MEAGVTATELSVASVASVPSLSHWYAVATRSRHEKVVAEQLAARQVEHFLPTYESVRRWRDRRARVLLPLFPGYVFARVAPSERLRVLEVPGVARFVSFSGKPAALADAEIDVLRRGLQGVMAEPCPYLKVGRRVRIRRGPFQEMEGLLVRKKDSLRLVISLHDIQRSIAVEVDVTDVEPLDSHSR